MLDYSIIDAEFTGSVLAERLAGQTGKRVLIVDKCLCIGSNAYNHHDDSGELSDHSPVCQPALVVHGPNDVARARVTEADDAAGQERRRAALAYEYPRMEGDACHPVPRSEHAALYNRDKAPAGETAGVHCAGRLAMYRHDNNRGQVAAPALAAAARIVGARLSHGPPRETGRVAGSVVGGWVHA